MNSTVELPGDLQVLVEHQTWARLHGDGTATLGITRLGIALAGEIYMCRPKPVGSDLVQGRSMGVVELAKAIVSVKSPVSGTVLAVNPLLEEQPELVHADPYGAGWLVAVRLAAAADELARLLQGPAAVAAMQHHAGLNKVG